MNKIKINTFIITGFLGVGKTTFLNHLLRNYKEANNVVIENEFGNVNIDKDLIARHYDSIYDFTNGCICCSSEGELLNIISQIGFTAKRPDNLIIECTGIADVNRITSTFKIGDFEEVYSLRPVICVVDCTVVLKIIEQTLEASLQIVGADWILLNKFEDVDLTHLEQIKSSLSSINPYVKFKKLEEITLNLLETERHNEHSNLTQVTFTIDNPHKINNRLYESTNPANMDTLHQVFTMIMHFYTDTFFRIKGFVLGQDGLTYELQLASGSFKLTPIDLRRDKTQIVFIGKQLEQSSIDRLMRPIFKHKINEDEKHQNN